MEDKYNHLSVAAYGTNLAKLLCDQYFTGSQTISGPQLISFTPIRQVNLFVIKELMVQWNREVSNLRSPYFDFENEEVKAALVQFMNVLSRKILMRRPAFEPLLAKAVYDTFMVVLDPVSVLDEKFLLPEEDPTPASLQDSLKYLDIDKALFANFIQSLSSRLERVYVLDRFREYLATDPPRTDVETLLNQFNRLLPVSRRDLTGKSPVLSTDEPQPAAPARPAPARAAIRIEKAPAPARPVQASPSPARPPAPKPAAAPDHNLNEKYKVEKPSRAEVYAKATTASSLAESQTNRPIHSLKDSISINQRYGFINELFSGENMEYHATIKRLDEFRDPDAAKNYLLKDVAGKYDWTKKEEHVNKLLKLIDRKFTA